MSRRRGSFDNDYEPELDDFDDAAGGYGSEEDCNYDMDFDAEIKPPKAQMEDGDIGAAKTKKSSPVGGDMTTPLLRGKDEDEGEGDDADGDVKDSKSAFRSNAAVPRVYTSCAALSPTATLNTGEVNERGFHVAEVNMYLQGSLRDFATGQKAPVLKLESSFAGFERPGASNGVERKTRMFAQGRVYLLSGRSTFPCSIAMVPAAGMRGRHSNTVWAQNGLKCAHIFHPDDKYSYAHSPLLLLDSDMGKYTEKFQKEFPDFLQQKSIKKMYRKVPGSTSTVEVDVKTPLFRAINGARARLIKEAANKGQQIDLNPLDDKCEHAKIQGYVYAPAEETFQAAKQLSGVMKTHVNYTPLYENLAFQVARAFSSSQAANESGASKANNAQSWLDPVEIAAKKKNKNEELSTSAFDEQHMLHARLLVEYKPLSRDDEEESGGEE